MWQKAMDLVDMIYDVVEGFPPRENFGLSSQLTRAAVSVPANIAEGRARSSAKDFANFLTMARASLMEVDTLIAVAERRAYVSAEAADITLKQVSEISRMLSGLKRRISEPRGGN